MRRSAALFLVIVLLISSLFSCSNFGSAHARCRKVVAAMTAAEIGLPAGKYYSLSALEGEEEYLPKSLMASLFGKGSLPEVATDWLDCAVFLSIKDSPCEFAVILCSNRDAAEDTAALFYSRLVAIKVIKTTPEYSAMIENASITITGNYAIFIISTDPATALKVANTAIRK